MRLSPLRIDPAKITVEPGVSYLPSPIKLHDYAAGVMAAFGSAVEHLGRVRGLPSQTMTLNRRLCGFHLNELQTQFLNGYSVMIDRWPMAADSGTYRTNEWRWGQSSANSSLFPLFLVLREYTGKFVEFRRRTTIDVRLREGNSIACQPNSLSIGSGKLFA